MKPPDRSLVNQADEFGLAPKASRVEHFRMNRRSSHVVLVLLAILGIKADAATIRTIAGNGIRGFSGDGGRATAANLDNPFGVVHGGIAATLFDSALGCAVQTLLPPASAAPTMELHINYIRPITISTGRIPAPVSCNTCTLPSFAGTTPSDASKNHVPITGCPASGNYTDATVGATPACSLGSTVTPAHTLP